MELIEIKELFEIDYGSPSPMVISNDNIVHLIFYSNKEFIELHERNTVYDNGVIELKFKNYLKYSIGLPSNESIYNHKYSNLGLNSGAFYELKNSDLIADLKKTDLSHPNYNESKWDAYKHFILTFHDNMFECVAKDFEIVKGSNSTYFQAKDILNQMISEQI